VHPDRQVAPQPDRADLYAPLAQMSVLHGLTSSAPPAAPGRR